MASDVQNLTTFYGNLPSIFENDSIKSLTDQTMTVIDKKNTYQPMFGSFLFTESEPFAHAAFVESTASSIDDKQPIDQTNSIVNTNSNQTIESLPKASIEDSSDIDDIDEDDFDGIPIRHGSSMTKDFSNSDNHLLEQIAQHIEHDDDDDNNNLIDVDDLFLNGFQDEHHQQINETITMPSLFSNIPDIDDLNEHMDDDDDDDENDRDQVPFDHMDMFDQSDSICSSSPDSLLSSSHLREEDDSDDDNYDEDLNRQVNHINIISKNDDDDDDVDDDVTQWDDDDLLAKTTSRNDRPNAPLPLRVSLNSQSHDQVDFIDSSRSNSRCSNASSHLSNGYTDQARIFINDDDGLVTSSSSSSANSECDEQDRQNLHLDDEIFIRDSDEEPPLQINLDYDRSRSVSTSSSCDSSQSISSPIADQSPIIAIDEDIIETKTQLPSAPIAVVDDEDIVEEEEEQKYDNQLLFISNQPVFSSSPLKNLMDLRNEHQKNHIVHDIVNIRHLLNEHNDDDEFLAIMHNPAIFEEVLHVHDDQQKSDLFEQIFLQQSLDDRNESESFEHNENMQQTSLLSISDNDTNSPSTIITTTVPGTRTHSSSTAVNHLREKKNEEEIREEDADVVNRSLIKLDTRQQSQDKNLSNINLTAITNCEKKEQHDHYQMMDSDDGSDNDSELLQTLAQLHGLVHTHHLSNDNNQIDFLMNHEQTDLNNTKQQHQNTANFDDENTSQNIFKDKSTPCVSLSSLSSSVLFNNDESQIQDVVIDSDSSSNSDIQSVVERLVSDTLQRAVEQIDNTHEPIEHFVEQILSEAVYDIYREDQNEYESKKDNLLPIVQRHNQPTKQILDPFDQNFHQVWVQDFQTPEYTKELFSSIPPNQAQENLPQSLPIDPFNLSVLTASVKNMNRNNSSSFQDDFTFFMNNASTSETNEQHEEKVQQTDDQDPVPLRDNSDENQTKKHESFFQDQTRLSQFEDFPSEQPLNTQTFETIHSDAGNPFDEPTDIHQSTNDNNDEPWELEEGDEVIKPIPTFISQDQTLITNEPTKTEESDDSTSDSSEDENDKENIDDYFPKEEIQQKQSIDDNNNNNNNDNDEPTEIIAPKSVRFDDSLQNVTVFTPKDSLVQSEVSSQATTSDTDEYDDEKITTRLSQTTEQINQNSNHTNETTDNAVQRPYSNISLTSEVDSYPPPLPPLPPLEQKPTSANSNILSKSTSSKQASTNNSKGKINLPTTDARLYHNESEFAQSHTSAILRSVSNDDTTNDADEIDNIITCMIDNNEIKIDAKTISPFKCIISSAGQLQDERKTAIIVLYGCWLPNHRLREYRYIMDQLFYYVYHKLQKLVADDYVLVYFHGATPKHQTPELKYLKKCYQMINFRLRKNLRNVYIVHPTLWLRTIVALSRPFFSNKFYHKVQYLYTIAELERQFPNNRIPIPDVIERVEKSGYTPDYV